MGETCPLVPRAGIAVVACDECSVRVFVIHTATSGGDRSSITNTHHGACVKHNMKLSVQVCCRPDNVGELLVCLTVTDHYSGRVVRSVRCCSLSVYISVCSGG